MNPLFLALLAIGLSLLLRSLRKSIQNSEEQASKERAQKVQEIERAGGLLARELGKDESLSDEKLEILHLAASQQSIRFNLVTEKKVSVVPYPTGMIDYVQVTDASQLPFVSPDQMVLDEDLFYRKFVSQELMRPEYYEVSETAKRLYILLDISPSMMEAGDKMPDGHMRDTWARGVVAGLLIDAVKGQAEYLLRRFSDTVHELRSARTPSEAEVLLHEIASLRFKGSGTNIARAVKVAAEDVRGLQSHESRMSHILLITDGDDQRGLTSRQLEQALGEDVKLHVVLIGTSWWEENPLSPYVIAKY